MPALLTRTSRRPAASATDWTSFFWSSSRRASAAKPRTTRFSFANADEALVTDCSERPEMKTENPSRASRFAIAAPMPRVPPVTSATRLCAISGLPSGRGRCPIGCPVSGQQPDQKDPGAEEHIGPLRRRADSETENVGDRDQSNRHDDLDDAVSPEGHGAGPSRRETRDESKNQVNARAKELHPASSREKDFAVPASCQARNGPGLLCSWCLVPSP